MLFIAVSGGPSCGKKKVCDRIIKLLDDSKVCPLIISQRQFYRELNAEEVKNAKNFKFHFDHPNAFDIPLMVKCLKELKSGNEMKIPVYDFTSFKRIDSQIIKPCDVVIVEGLFALYEKELRDLFDMKIFVDVDSDVRLTRRVESCDASSLEAHLNYFLKYAKSGFDDYILPTKKYADIIIPRGYDNDIAIGIIVDHIKNMDPSHHHSAQRPFEPLRR